MKSAIPFTVLFLSSVSTHAVAQAMDAEQLAIAKNYVRKAGLDATVELQVEEMRRNLPIQSSQLEYLAGVTYLKPYKTQVFRHVTMPGWTDIVGKNSGMTSGQVKSTLPQVMQQQTVNAACSVEFTRFMLENGLKIKHDYFESDGSFMFSTTVVTEDCK